MKNLYKSSTLLILIALLSISLLVLDVMLFRQEPMMFWVSMPILLLIAGLTVGKVIQIRRREYLYFEQMNLSVKGATGVALNDFPQPVVLLDENRTVVWWNESFSSVFFTPNEENNSIDTIIGDNTVEMYLGEGREEIYGNRTYRIYLRSPEYTPDEGTAASEKGKKKAEQEIVKLNLLIFEDVTEYKALQKEYDLSRPMAMLIVVDNYEELLSESKESEKGYVTYQIDKLLEDHFTEKNAVLQKISADRFMVIIEERYIREMIYDKFSILELAHSIKVNEHTNTTFSIGVGRGAETLAQSEEFAREALIKALGRGGDQAAIKTSMDFHYYGATTQATNRAGKIKTRIVAESIKELACTADTVYIMGHSWGDFDSVGSAIGLTCAIRRLGINAYTVVNREATMAEPLLKRFDSGYDIPLFMTPDAAVAAITDNSVLIIVDTHLEKKLEVPELLEKAERSRVVVIDHHRLGNEIKDVTLCHDPNASSAAELVTELIQYFGVKNILKPVEAEALLAGITLDTKNFVMRSGVSTFEAAAYLRRLGADTISVKTLFNTSIQCKELKSKIVFAAQLYRNCAVSVAQDTHPDIRMICSQAADEMLSIDNVDASFTIYPAGEDNWGYCARSMGAMNVQVIMESLGNKKDDGGGHQTMAGALLCGLTLDEARSKLFEAIDGYYDTLSQV